MEKVFQLIKMAQSGDKSALDTLMRENSGLIWSIVRKFSNRGYEAEDLYQIGAIGLMKCIQKFDTAFDVKFSTYAVPMIIGEIKRFVRDDGMIKVARPLKTIAQKARYTQEMLIKKNGREPSISELAEALDVTRDDLVMAMESSMMVESLYSTVNNSDNGPIYLIDKLDEKKADNDEANVVDIIALKQVIGRLKPRERQIIILRYFDDMTQSDIAKKIGVSQVQVSRIEKKVLRELKESLYC